jgi:hypothetical protein
MPSLSKCLWLGLQSAMQVWSIATHWGPIYDSDDRVLTLFHSWWFDPMSAVLSFVSAIAFFSYFERAQNVSTIGSRL